MALELKGILEYLGIDEKDVPDMDKFKETSMFILMIVDKIHDYLLKAPEAESPYEGKANGPTDPAIK